MVDLSPVYDGETENEKFQKRMERAREFQDYVCIYLQSRGWSINNLSSHKYQRGIGENLIGMEIKEDFMFRITGNLFIQTSQKKRDSEEWYSAGIDRNDNSIMYIIGDEAILYLFSIKHLRAAVKGWKYKTNGISAGYLCPLGEAEVLSICTFYPAIDQGVPIPQTIRWDANRMMGTE